MNLNTENTKQIPRCKWKKSEFSGKIPVKMEYESNTENKNFDNRKKWYKVITISKVWM